MKVVSDPKDGNYMQIPDYQKQIDELGADLDALLVALSVIRKTSDSLQETMNALVKFAEEENKYRWQAIQNDQHI